MELLEVDLSPLLAVAPYPLPGKVSTFVRPYLPPGRVARVKFARTYSRSIKPGDVIKRQLKDGLPLQHYGVYESPDHVYEFNGDTDDFRENKIRRVSLAHFASGKPWRIEEYANKAPLPPEEVLRRARALVGEKDYDLLANNCEHFANWCKYDHKFCSQVWLASGLIPFGQLWSRSRQRELRRRLSEQFDQYAHLLREEREILQQEWDQENHTRNTALESGFAAIGESIRVNDMDAVLRQLRQVAVLYDAELPFQNSDEFKAFMLDPTQALEW